MKAALASLLKKRWLWVLVLIGVPVALYAAGSWSRLFPWPVFSDEQQSQPILILIATVIHLRVPIYDFVVFLLLFDTTLWLLARFVLPVQTREQHRKVHRQLWLYVTGGHGPALFVKNGKRIASREEHLRKGPGIALVDPASAIALEKETPPAPLTPRAAKYRRGLGKRLYQLEKQLWHELALAKRRRPGFLLTLLYYRRWLGIALARYFHQQLLRAKLVRPRKLIRPPRAARVEGPGIVFIRSDERVRDTLDLRRQIRFRPGIKGLTRDGIEVRAKITVIFRLDDEEESADDNGAKKIVERNRPAFKFNRQSAFRAVYGTPTYKKREDGADEDVKAWTDLTAFVASDIFRDLLSTTTLDNLFRPTSDQDFPLTAFREEFARRAKAEPVLRERGIRVISANIGDLTLPEAVMEQRIASWRADWTRRSLETLAGGDLQAGRIIQRARVSAQYDMVRQIQEIMQEPGSKAAIVWRLFQALESASADPSTRRLLPTDTVRLLTGWLENLRGWLKP